MKIDIPSCLDCEHRGDSLLCNLKHEELDNLSKAKTHSLFKKGQVIFYEGNQPHGIYCVHEGKVKVHKLSDEGKEQIVRFAGNSSFLGYRSLLSNEAYTATATAMEDTYVCHISKNHFFELLKENNDFSLKTMQLLTKDLKNAELRIMNMAQKPVKEKIAEALLVLYRCFGFLKDEETLNITITRREIGDMAGTTTETTIRMLSDLQKDGIIQLKGKKIVVPDLKALALAANVTE